MQWRTFECCSCHFQWVHRDDLRRKDVQPSYDDYGYNKHIHATFKSMRSQYLAGFKIRIARTIGPEALERRAFADVGCANGEYLATARDLGFGQVLGVEIDRTAAQNAARYGPVIDSVALLPPAAFDVIQVKNVLGNIDDFGSFLHVIVRCLKPHGYLFLDVPHAHGAATRFRTAVRAVNGRGGANAVLRPPYVINGFTRRSVALLLGQSGLAILRIATSYLGSEQVPYRYAKHEFRTAAARFAALVGAGSMLLSESRLV